METSEQINEIAAALAKAQSEITGAAKGTENTFFKSRYADLAACWEACRGPLTKNGLCVVQTPSTDEAGAVTVTTLLAHQSGQWIKDVIACKPAKNDAQALGSVVTFLRRYSLSAISGLAQVDDDGEAAVGRGENGEKMTPTRRKKAGLWKGPLQVTALKNKLTDLNTALKAAESQEAVAHLTSEEYADVLQQAAEDLPDWFAQTEKNIAEALKGLPVSEDSEPDVSDFMVPVPASDNGPNWRAWHAKVADLINKSESLAQLNDIAEANKVPFGNYAKADKDAAAGLKTLIDNRRGFHAQEPGEAA